MNDEARLERIFSDALAESAPSRAPDRLRADIKHAVGQTRPRPRWLATLREAPMHTLSTATVGTSTARRATAPSLRLAWFLLIALLLVALATGGIIVGSRLFQATAYPIPRGGEAVLVFESNGDIFTVRADGTDMRQLTGGPDLETTPAWSPDGTRIAYRLWHDTPGAACTGPANPGEEDRCPGSDSVVVMDAGGGHRTTLATVDQPYRFGCVPNDPAAWSPDGTSLIYPTSTACDGRNDLLIVPTTGSSAATALLAPGLNSSYAAWSPDGTQVVFQGREATSTGLYVVDVGGGSAMAGGLTAHRISDEGVDSDQWSWRRPHWSPDGTEVAASAGMGAECWQPTSGTSDAFAVQADGSSQRPLTVDITKEYVPTWSPDGRHLAFLRLVDPSEGVAGQYCTVAPWVVDADGANERRIEGLGPDAEVQPPLWSPDGTRIVGDLSTPGGESAGLYVATVDGSSPLMTIPDIGKGFASWQPLAAPLLPAPSFAAFSPSP